MTRTRQAKRIINSPCYFSNRMESMNRECSYYVEQMTVARNGILRRAFANMASIYQKRYEYYLKKCTENELGKSI